ncbi:DUF1501 domain-containing protein [bacterium]|nr:DUF1501 domain-containing protein [bacterium]MCI0604585.1 DUF1501 domain-containing protein [bacterium]
MQYSRRNFIKTTAIAAAGLALFDPRYALGRSVSTSTGNKVLVVINLLGGNDGLNTVIPVSSSQYDKYRELRSSLALDRDSLLPLDGQPDFSLNPQLSAFQDLFGKGKLAIINGVSVPEQAVGLFDHEAGQYEFQTCDIIRNLSGGPASGWLGRYLDTLEEPVPGQISPGVDMGGGRLMLTGESKFPVSINSIDNFQLQVSYDEQPRRAAYSRIMEIPNGSNVGERNRTLRVEALAQSEVIAGATQGYQPSVTYPETYLGFQLRDCAKLIYGDVGVRALAVGIGGFDTHSAQNQASGEQPGLHDSLLKDLSDSTGAFYQDLVNHGLSSNVLILTISEFGRRAYENNDLGTDHGFASIAFAAGDMVLGGLYGIYPDLNQLVLDGNLGMTNDFRSVYATVLGSHLGVDPQPILDPNHLYPDFDILGFL